MKPTPTPQTPAVIDNPIPAYQPLPAPLTDAIAEPAPPPARCSYLGVPAVCVMDALLWIDAWRGQLEHSNVDRAASKTVTTPATAHP